MTLRLSRAEFREWTTAQPRGRYERVGGEVIAMSAERIAHIRLKARVWQSLDRAIRAAGLDCEALADGVTLEIDDDTDYEPDVVVNCGPPLPGEAIAAPNPTVVVEVLSPSTAHVDTGAKLSDYFRLPSVRHYLVVRSDRREVMHHARGVDGLIATRIVGEGRLDLSPPGMAVTVESFYAA